MRLGLVFAFSDICNAANFISLDHRVGAGEESWRHFKAQRPRGRQIDDEVELDRLLDRDVAWLRPAQNLVDIIGGAPEQVREVRSIGHQTSRFDELPKTVHRWQSRGQRQGIDANAVGVNERVDTDIQVHPRDP